MSLKFQQDLANGIQYEKLYIKKFIPKKSKVEHPQGYLKEYDFKVYKSNGTISTYEVKSDKQINIYGNICIEYECRNKPSGISTSTAKYWAIFEPKGAKYRVYKIPSKIIRKYIEEQKYERIAKGGDKKASKLYLFDKNLFKEYIIYNNIDDGK